MKNTGIVRRLDDLGRITLPKELRRTMNIGEKDPLEICVDEERIILQKYNGAGCVFCGSSKNVQSFKGKPVCCDCKGELAN